VHREAIHRLRKRNWGGKTGPLEHTAYSGFSLAVHGAIWGGKRIGLSSEDSLIAWRGQ
jgi:hypothetical protein